jgi:hypothetical protein
MAFNPTYAKVGDNGLDVYGATEVGCWTITFGGADTYVTGGLALVSQNFGLSRPIAGVNILGINTAAITLGIGDNIIWNTQTQKLQMEGSNATVTAGAAGIQELNNGVSIANLQVTVQVFTLR